MGALTHSRQVITLRTGDDRRGDGLPERRDRPDAIAVEDPVEIRVNGVQLSVTMRSPGDDFDLVAGFLVSEGLVLRRDDLVSMRYCAGRDEQGHQQYNVIDASVPARRVPDRWLRRRVTTTSACGVCGTASLDAVARPSGHPVGAAEATVAYDLLASLPERLRDAQVAFERTGGLHAAGLFTFDGECLCVREDVGRHNAVDKVIGWALRADRLPLADTVLQVSGRASFELAQKASMAGIPVLAAVSAPSSLAVDVAVATGITLVGFNRASGMNVYSVPERIGGLPSKA